MESRQFRIKKIKSQIRLFLPLFLLFLSFCFLVFSTFENPYLSQAKMTVKGFFSPVIEVLTIPVKWGKGLVSSSSDFMMTYRQNNALRQENEKLKNWRNIALQLNSEQKELKKLLNYVPPKNVTFVTAKVLMDDGARFSKSLIVSAGSEQGVQKGDVAMTSTGVFGRIVEVSSTISRLMLLTDYASRVPVIVGETEIHAFLSGDGDNLPKIISLPENTTVFEGDVVLTSGQVGVFPTGLGIGIVESIIDGDIRVRLFEEDETPDFVRLVNFGLSNILIQNECPVPESE